MNKQLPYGEGLHVSFADESGTQFFPCCSDARPLKDLAAAVKQAVAEPLDFPPLSQAVVPGDKVVLALGRRVPQGIEIAGVLTELLRQWNIAAEDITLLVADAQDAERARPLGLWTAVVVHDPDRRDQMAYLAATAEGSPLYLNRLLCDADVVIPIATVRMQARGAKASDGLYPVFSHVDKPTPPGRRRRKQPPQQPTEPPDACWLLGVPCLVQVVPGPGSSAWAVVAGEPHAASRESQRRCEAAWRFSLPRRVSLVVAAIEGDAAQQQWQQFGRALEAATAAVEEDGAIAICCQLSAEPGPALQALAEGDDRHDTLRAVRRQQLPDARVAARLVRACNQATVYLLSDLDEDLVQQLGMAPVHNAAEVARLATHHESCVLLGNAQHARAMPEE